MLIPKRQHHPFDQIDQKYPPEQFLHDVPNVLGRAAKVKTK
jgi:hypothetical protein